MKQFLTLILLLTLSFAFAQHKLNNTYSSYTEILGGTEDSSTSITETYIFVAKSRLNVLTVHYEGQILQMKKGDTLQISVHHTDTHDETEPTFKPSVSLNATAQLEVSFKKGNAYYVNVNYPVVWFRVITYSARKKTYMALTKEGFNTVSREAAP